MLWILTLLCLLPHPDLNLNVVALPMGNKGTEYGGLMALVCRPAFPLFNYCRNRSIRHQVELLLHLAWLILVSTSRIQPHVFKFAKEKIIHLPNVPIERNKGPSNMWSLCLCNGLAC